MATISIEGMEFFAFHGVHPEEQKIGRTFMVDALIDYDVEAAAIGDDVTKTVDYAAVYAIAKKQMTISEKLIETVARKIALKVKGQYPNAENVTIKLTKFAPMVGGKVEKATVRYIA